MHPEEQEEEVEEEELHQEEDYKSKKCLYQRAASAVSVTLCSCDPSSIEVPIDCLLCLHHRHNIVAASTT